MNIINTDMRNSSICACNHKNPGVIDHITASMPFILPTIIHGADQRFTSRSYLLAANTFVGSTAILASYYQTRRFCVNGKINLSEVGKFAFLTTYLSLFNLVYCFPSSDHKWTWLGLL